MANKKDEQDELIKLEAWNIYKKACKEYEETDPSDPMYEKICENRDKAANEYKQLVLESYYKKKEHKRDVAKFIGGLAANLIMNAATLGFGFIMLDHEAEHMMTSKFWPKVQQALPLKLWGPNTNQ